MPPLDHDRCYAAASSRDARFDGWFVTAVRTTGIYCRPSCPAITPKSSNVEFHHTAAAAQQRGFRACKRCRPDATPGSPDWNTRQDVVARCMRLIADGIIERSGVSGLAAQLGYSERHLNRLLTDEVGAGPLAVARAQRAQTARILIETTDVKLTDIAFAAGFGSVRQFNDTVRAIFASTPGELRSAASTRSDRGPGKVGRGKVGRGTTAPLQANTHVTLRLPTRAPFAAIPLLEFLGRRAIPGVESFGVSADGPIYRRTLDLERGHGVVTLRPGGAKRVGTDGAGGRTDPGVHIDATLQLADWSDLASAVQRIRRLLDLDADPEAVDAHLGDQPGLGQLVAAAPGRRSPASVDPYETAIRAVIGQQVSVAGARTVTAKIVEALGEPLAFEEWGPDSVDASDEVRDRVSEEMREAVGGSGSDSPNGLTSVFPTAETLAVASDDVFSMPTARRDTIRRLAVAVADGAVELDVGVEPDVARRQLLGLKGIGPWTADYVVMRGLGHPDTMLSTDLGVIHAARGLGLGSTPTDIETASRSWSPWRSYAVHHLWASLSVTDNSRSKPTANPIAEPIERPTAEPIPTPTTNPAAGSARKEVS